MKTYKITFPGVSIGGVIILRAKNKQCAIAAASAQCWVFLEDLHETPEKILIKKIKETAVILYHQDGDY